MSVDKKLTILFGHLLLGNKELEKALIDFESELMKMLELDYISIEIPMLGIVARIPEKFEREGVSRYVGDNVVVELCGDLKKKEGFEEALKTLDKLVELSVNNRILEWITEDLSNAIIFIGKDGCVLRMNRKAREIFGEVKTLPNLKDLMDIQGERYVVKSFEIGNARAYVLINVTELEKRLKESLSEVEGKFRDFAEFSPVGIVVCVGEKILYTNAAMEEITGYDRKELRNVFMLFDKEDFKRVREMMDKMNAGESAVLKLKLIRKDGESRIVQLYSTLTSRGEIVMFFADVSEIESERRKSEELVRIVSLANRILRHDVMNALTSALLSLEMFEETGDKRLPGFMKRSLERAVSAIRNAKMFEEVAKMGELKAVKVGEIAREVAKDFNISISVDGECEVLADEGLRSVFENLFQNAIQHSGSDRIEVRIEKVGDWCIVRVADYGKRIPDDVKRMVFEEGFSWGEEAGTGLGLFIVKKLIERYGGEIWVEDNVPKGSVFVLKLKVFS